jgi:hypothetical protein
MPCPLTIFNTFNKSYAAKQFTYFTPYPIGNPVFTGKRPTVSIRTKLHKIPWGLGKRYTKLHS